MKTTNPNIAIVHDWFINNSMGGAEKVTKLIFENLRQKFLEPDIFALVENMSYSKKIYFQKKNKYKFFTKFPFGVKKFSTFFL